MKLGLVLLVAFVASACAAPTPSPLARPKASTGPSPTSELTAIPGTSDPPDVCEPAKVALTPGSSGGAAGTSYLTIRVALVGDQPCRWPASPAVRLRDSTGQVIASGAEGGGESATLRTTLGLNLGWASWCDPLPSRPLTLGIQLGAGAEARMTIPDSFGAGCMDVPTIVFLELAGT